MTLSCTVPQVLEANIMSMKFRGDDSDMYDVVRHSHDDEATLSTAMMTTGRDRPPYYNSTALRTGSSLGGGLKGGTDSRPLAGRLVQFERSL